MPLERVRAHVWVLEVNESSETLGLLGINGLRHSWATKMEARASVREGLYTFRKVSVLVYLLYQISTEDTCENLNACTETTLTVRDHWYMRRAKSAT